MKKLLLIFGISVVLLFFINTAEAQDVGAEAPEFSYTDLNDSTYELSKMAGKVVFIYTFGNGCPYCVASAPDTEKKVQEVYGSRTDFQALGFDTWDNSSSTASVSSFKTKTGVTYPLFTKAGSFEDLYKTTYDRVLVIDQEGVLRHKNNVAVNGDLDNAIKVIEELFLSTGIKNPQDGLQEGLSHVYPNPSGDRASVRINLVSGGRVDVRLFNPLGLEVKRISGQVLPAGEHTREFSVSELPSGIYFLRMNTTGASYTRKIQVSR